MRLPLSILDLTPLPDDRTSVQTLAESVELALHAERLGYERVWYAEHHSLPGIASTSPELMIAYVGARTSRIRLGAGGVMLPNHPSLRVAESYRLLQAMVPGRVDLGLGRAPGTDQRTALAIRGPHGLHRDDFEQQVDELVGWGTGRPPVSGVHAQPDDQTLPPVWLLGSSDFSARLAARRGFPFAYAAHFSPAPPDPPMLAYKSGFRAGYTDRPRSMLAVAAFCADTVQQAEELARPSLIAFVRLRTGQAIRPPGVEAARRVHFTPLEAAVAEQVRATQIVGTPDDVARRVSTLAARTRADEVMVATHAADHAGRLASVEKLAAAWAEHGPLAG